LTPDLVLASASPRRAAILSALGVSFRVEAADVDETPLEGEAAEGLAERLARAKAAAVVDPRGLPVVAADTVVVCDGTLLGKPACAAEARAMLARLQGRDHEVVTGVCVARGAALRSGVERTLVEFAPMSAAEIDWYVATGEPADKAGAYHIDGRGALFVVRVSGSPSNVAGLPVGLLRRLLGETGVRLVNDPG
jgi:septum formation protein